MDGCALLNGRQIARASHALGPLVRKAHRLQESARTYLESVGARQPGLRVARVAQGRTDKATAGLHCSLCRYTCNTSLHGQGGRRCCPGDLRP
jgi:hypothetical protein